MQIADRQQIPARNRTGASLFDLRQTHGTSIERRTGICLSGCRSAERQDLQQKHTQRYEAFAPQISSSKVRDSRELQT
jgi:hypothetical protein